MRAAGAHRLLAILGLVLTFTIFILGGLVILNGRQQAWQQTETSSENLMLALRRDLSRKFALLDLSLQGAQEALSIPGLANVSPDIFEHAVFDSSASAEDIAAFLVIDTSGCITHHAKSTVMSDVNLSDRDYFRVHAESDDAGLFFSSVYRSRLNNGQPRIALTRRLSTPDGQFAGIVMGAVQTDYIKQMFQNLDLGPHGSITVLTNQGRIVYRNPFREQDINRKISHTPVVDTILAAEKGQFVGTASLDGVARLYTFGRIAGTPLILAVNLSVDDIYAAWRSQAWMTGSILAILCASTLALTLLFYREVQRRSAAETKLTESARQLAIMAATDGLTGLGNRRAMETEIEREWKRAIRSSSPIALLMIDVDHFKLFNDRYGHPEGDAVLAAVATCLQHNVLRPADTVSRYGGEEFVGLLPDTDAAGAMAAAERIRAGIQALQIPHAAAPRGYVSISIGVAVAYPVFEQSEAGLLKTADLALYEAKNAGRNRVHFAICTPNAPLLEPQQVTVG